MRNINDRADSCFWKSWNCLLPRSGGIRGNVGQVLTAAAYLHPAADVRCPPCNASSPERFQVPILDANKFLSDGTKSAIKTGALLSKGKITVLIVDEQVCHAHLK